MADIVQYAAGSAIKNDKQIRRQARAVSVSGAGGKKSIIDGYVVITTRTAGGTMTRVVDTPAIVSFVSWTQPVGLASRAFGYSQQVGTRDTFMPGVTFSGTPAAPPGLVPVAYSYKYVAPHPDSINTPLPFSRAGIAWVDGDTVSNVGPLAVTTPGGSEPDLLLYVVGVRWGSRLVKADEYTELVSLDPDRAVTTDVLYVHARSLAIAASKTTAVVSQSISNVFRPIGFSEAGTTYLAVHARDNAAGLDERDEPLLLVGALVVGEAQEVPIAWARALGVGAAATPKTNVYVPDVAGMHVGEDITLLSTVWDNTGWYSTKRYVLDKTTGATLSYTVLSDSNTVVYAPITSTTQGLWVAKAERTSGAGYINLPTTTWLMRGTTETQVDLDGWTPLSTLLRGFDWVGLFGPNTSPVSAAVVQLSEGVLGVVACPAPSSPTGYDFGDTFPVHLLEVDEATLTVTADRGFIANASLDFSNWLYIGFNVTVVTPEKRTAGVVTTPAVLLCSYASTTRLSTDGGATWAVVATGVSGYPYYHGNRLHPFEVGKAL